MTFNPRILEHGAPNHGKTRSILTFPRPIFVVNSPGERGGHGSLPDADPSVVVYPDIDPSGKSSEILKEFKAAYTEAIKSGKYQTIAIEGIHKVMGYVMDDITGGGYFAGDKPDWNVFGLCYHWMDRALDVALINNIHAVVVTAWSTEKAERKARKGEKADDIPSTILPNLLGDYRTQVLGGFQMVFHQILKLYPDGREDKEGKKLRWAAWQTRPTQAVQGCGIKGPEHLVDAIPLYIPADYRYLKQIWEENDK